MALRLPLLAILVLAGCLEPATESSAPRDPLAPSAPASIEGTVTDDELVPLANATVVLVETGESERTGPEGRFLFDEVRTGTVTVAASLEGYAPAQVTIEVTEGGGYYTKLVLDPLPSTRAYHETLQREGIVCGWALLDVVSGTCTGHSARFELPFPADWSLVLTEVAWTPRGLSSDPTLRITIANYTTNAPGNGTGCTGHCPTIFARQNGPSPLRSVLAPNRTHTELGGRAATPMQGVPLAAEVEMGKDEGLPATLPLVGFVMEQPVTVFRTNFYFHASAADLAFSALPPS